MAIWVPLTPVPAFRAGWAYLSGERPSLNVPYSVLALEPTLQNNNVCGTTATFTNLTCDSPPEVVNVSWYVQSIDAIQDVNQIVPLNMVLNVQWRDWRLAYAEGGFGCWATSLQLAALTSAAATTLAANLTTAIATLWSCTSPTNCAGSPLPSGVLPTVSVTTAGLVTVFPAPVDWQRSCTVSSTYTNPLLSSVSGTPCTATSVTSTAYTAKLTAALAAIGGSIPAAAVWLPVSVPCVGAGARKLPPALTLSTGQAQGTPPSGFGGPGGGPGGVPGSMSYFPWGTSLDHNTIWDPASVSRQRRAWPRSLLTRICCVRFRSGG